MHRLTRIALAASFLVAAAPAAAQYAYPPPPPPPPPGAPYVQAPPVYRNVLRVDLGVSFYNSGWYNCYTYYPYYSCSSGSYTSYIPFTVGPQLDINVGGPNNISIGFDVLIGTITASYYNGPVYQSKSSDVTIWEPTVDYVAKFGPPTLDTVGRFRVGGGMYIGPNSGLGGAFRIGGGASFLNTGRLGIGLDLVLEAGGYQGYWIGGLQLMASPEFHF